MIVDFGSKHYAKSKLTLDEYMYMMVAIHNPTAYPWDYQIMLKTSPRTVFRLRQSLVSKKYLKQEKDLAKRFKYVITDKFTIGLSK